MILRVLVFARRWEDAARWAREIGLERDDWRYVLTFDDIAGCRSREWVIVHLEPGMASRNTHVWDYLESMRGLGQAVEFVQPDADTFRAFLAFVDRWAS